MIETLQSFSSGWEDTKGKSELAFCRFLNEHDEFKALWGRNASDFYSNVRCGILHQAETRGGWKTTKKDGAPLFEPSTLTINASFFRDALAKVIEEFCLDLDQRDWKDKRWKNANKKFKTICENCKTAQ